MLQKWASTKYLVVSCREREREKITGSNMIHSLDKARYLIPCSSAVVRKLSKSVTTVEKVSVVISCVITSIQLAFIFCVMCHSRKQQLIHDP